MNIISHGDDRDDRNLGEPLARRRALSQEDFRISIALIFPAEKGFSTVPPLSLSLPFSLANTKERLRISRWKMKIPVRKLLIFHLIFDSL